MTVNELNELTEILINQGKGELELAAQSSDCTFYEPVKSLKVLNHLSKVDGVWVLDESVESSTFIAIKT
jgi:hypothetical protein